MIWYNIKELETLLINRKLSDKLAFNYLFIHVILITIAGHFSDEDPVWMVWTHLIINLLFVIWGVRKTFEINGKGGNLDYFKRFISISFVAGIRLLVIMFILGGIITLGISISDLAGVSFSFSALQKNIVEILGYLILMGIYYYILFSSFKRVNAAGGNTGD